MTVRGASGGGGGRAGMRSERVATAVHRLDHGSRATPRHDVAWMARPCEGLGGAARRAAVAGCGGGARALGGAGLPVPGEGQPLPRGSRLRP